MVLVFFRYSNTASREVGYLLSDSDQVTFSLRAAWIAAHSVFATTPTKLPSCTTFTTPATEEIEPSSTLSGLVLARAGRTTRPCSMPGTRTSAVYVNWPVSFG